jgi:hypothetical protein
MPRCKGAPKTGGRQKGTRNKRTLAQLEAMATSGEVLPLSYLLKIMRDEDEDPDRRMFAAKAAAPYCHPTLSAVAHSSVDEKKPTNYEVVLTFD